jgi:hypothetical protein
MESKKYVLVTTEHRGVFVGEFEAYSERQVTLTNARCAIRWGTTGGFLELAATGPTSRSKVGAVAPRIKLEKVTSIAECSAQAEQAWRDA